MKKIKIIKNRSDLGAGTRGSDLGIDAIEIAAINKKSNFFKKYDFEDIITHNDAIYDQEKTPYAKRLCNILNICTSLSNSVKKTLDQDMFPIIISGDHSSSLGTISGIKAKYPNKRLAVIWIDAHADLHSPYTTPSGNVHGMPLSAALRDKNLECQINKLDKQTINLWESMERIGVNHRKIHYEDLIYFGVRDTQESEDYVINKNKIKNYTVEEMRYRGFKVCLDEAIYRLKDCDKLYISFDVDSMDSYYISKGTGTPVNKGFDKQEVMQIINAFISTRKSCSFEVVEVNPTLDNKGNVMAETAFDIIKNTVEKLQL